MGKTSAERGNAHFKSFLERMRRQLFCGGGECHRIEQLISLAADRQATADDLADIDEHVAACQPCRVHRAAMELCGLELRRRPMAQMPAGLSDRLIAAIDEEERRESERARFGAGLRRSIPNPRVAWGFGAAAACACAAGLMLLMHVDMPLSAPVAKVVPVAPAPRASIASTPKVVATTHAAARVVLVASKPERTNAAPAPRHAPAALRSNNAGRSAAGSTLVAFAPRKPVLRTAVAPPTRNAATERNELIAKLPASPSPDDTSIRVQIPSTDNSTPPAEPASTEVASAPAPVVVAATYPSSVHIGLINAVRMARQSQSPSETVDVAAASPNPRYSSYEPIVSSAFR